MTLVTRCVDDEGCKGEKKVVLWNTNLQLRSNRLDLWCVCYVDIQYMYMIYDQGWIVITCKEFWFLAHDSWELLNPNRIWFVVLFHAIYYCLQHLKYCISLFIYYIVHSFWELTFFTDYHMIFISNFCFLVTSCTENPWRFCWGEDRIGSRGAGCYGGELCRVLALPVWKKGLFVGGEVFTLPVLP